MQSPGYSPYQAQNPPVKKKASFKLSTIFKKPRGWKKWLKWILGCLAILLFIIYLCLGDLRFFANNIFRLGFFQKDYLVLLQNNHELRPTGGFITGYGELSVTMGLPTGLDFHNSYEIGTQDYVTPPYPHEALLKNEWYQGYTFRDANWNPDFPSSAQELLKFYKEKFPNKEVDGIIVVNFSWLEEAVDRLGGITLNDERLTKENLFKKLTDSVNDVDRHSEEELAGRKSILSELAGPLASKLVFHPFKTKSLMLEGLENKDIFMWFENDTLQQKIANKGWANVMKAPENSDFLAVNLSNLGSKKADRYLLTNVNYHVDFKNDTPEAKLEVTLQLPGDKNSYADDYKGYLRLFIPETAELISDQEGLTIETQNGFKVIGVLVDVKAGESKTFTFNYKLPQVMSNDSYQLALNKQSGDDKYYSISLEHKNDHGFATSSFEPRENMAFWQGELKNDLRLSAKLLDDTTAPYPIEQVFSDLKTVSIYWNEPISPASGGEASNYRLIDLNKKNAEVTDEVKVVSVEVIDQNTSKLTVEGITEQELESYQIQMKGIRDVSNNLIEPEPKIVTVIQRIN